MSVRGMAPRHRQSRRGSSMPEMALVISMFLALVFGIVDMSRAVWAYNTVAHLAGEGSRYAMVRGNASGAAATADSVAAYVKGLSVGLPAANLTVTTAWSPNNSPGSTVSVKVQYPFRYILPYVPWGTVTLGSTSRSLIAQ
ncbi:MAG: pilus assembly protein [Candidatus Solibacter usitatus]|nr:pilus assembly protein [Candidatus Solibacter usitatus]